MRLLKLIEKHWYVKQNLVFTIILIIPACIFFIISKIRFYLYKFNLLKSYKLPVPVVIIGNISVGGVGKTPLTKMLALELIAKGKKVGIILRGYKSKNKSPRLVYANSDSSEVGDEALIYAINGLKVAIGSNRYLAGLKLLETYPDLNLILADDGLQHYKLHRDFEIAVVDTTRLFRNTSVLPMGPLRETLSRLNSVNAIVINTYSTDKIFKRYSNKTYTQEIVLDKIYNAVNKQTIITTYFTSKPVIAMAAIGNPDKFFNLLHQLGIWPKQYLIHTDHHHYKIEDIPKDRLVLVTEKDYTKLTKFDNPNIYVVLVKTSLNSNHLFKSILQLI